jgi:membrane-bound ClpP family serine protease
MSLTLIFLLIILGLILILLEVFVVPGTTVVGIGGAALLIFSIWEAYSIYGSEKGHYILLGTVAFIALTISLAFKTGTWKRMMLSTNIVGRVNVLEDNKLHVGDTGKAISRISPAGTALFDNELYEVHTTGDFIDQETELVISKLEDNKIYVKTK